MNVGYFMMPLHPPGCDWARALEHDLDQVVFLESLGFEEAWVGEHFTARWENLPCPDLFIAKALSMTRTIKFGTGVSCLPNHNPLMLAHRIAVLDQLARGRLYWGIGSGGFPGDFELFGFDPPSGEHRNMTRASLETILKLWSDPKPGLYESKYWKFHIPEPQPDIGLAIHARPYQLPHPPIAVAGISPKSDTLGLAGERGYIPMSINFVPARILKTHWESVEEGARRSGRTADRGSWRIARDIYIAKTSAQARREVLAGTLARDWREYFLPILKKVGFISLAKIDPDMPDSEVTIEYLIDHIWMVGDPDEVTEKLQKLQQDVGSFGTLLVIGHEWEPHEGWAQSMRLLKEQVLPACKN
jgi:alkanesulfonate monooxygenase SsuD/methylene tetrahydromethanopterin reductase-like flavin-dependent oxidoreductase (luciferase family)